jgi:hypothetical protein
LARFFVPVVPDESEFRRQYVNIVKKSGRSTAPLERKSESNGGIEQALCRGMCLPIAVTVYQVVRMEKKNEDNA